MSRLKIFAILVCTAVNLAYCQDTVESLENIITTGEAEALKYETPTDASKYRPKDNSIKKYDKSFDFIIIGGGISGSVLASRLSEEEKFSVLVIEAGKFADNGILKIPKYSYIGWLSDYNWGFKSIPQTTACLGTINNQCIYPRGKGVGGSSLINGLLYDRTSPENYNIIAALVNDSSWSYINVLKYFKKSERFHWTYRHGPVDPEFHGTHGLLDVQHQVSDIRLNDLWLKANEEMGIPVRDYNGARHSGGSIYQSYVRNGKRLDMGTAFLIPFLHRENLEVLTQSYVTKIIINKNTKMAEEVLFTKNGTMYSVKCNKEIILSAGTVSSPQILMLSGVGPKDHLKQHGIDVLEDLQVGTKFLDQPGTKNFMFATNYTSVNQTLNEQIEDFLNGRGKLTSPTTAQGIGFYRVSSRNFGTPDLEILYDLSTPSDSDKKINGWDSETYQTLWTNSNVSVSFAIRMVQPKSVGTIRLNSSDPFVYPLIDTNYLSDRYNEDIEVMYKGVNMVFNLIKTTAFRSINLTYVTPPLPACNKYEYMSKDYWYCFIRQVSLTCAHPVGTCAMGSDKSNGVVDSELKVFGVNRLRVVDASIIPRILDGHTSIPCVMIAEKIADVIKKQYIKQKLYQRG